MAAILMDAMGLHRTIIRLSHEIEERNEGLEEIVLVGVKRCGEIVAKRIQTYFRNSSGVELPCAGLDLGTPSGDAKDCVKNDLGFSIDGKTVVLCDDVLFSGRMAVKGVEELFRLGRPKKIQLLVLVDRGGREVPVRADYVGKNVPTSKDEYIEVCFEELGAPDKFTIVKGKKHERE